MYDIDSFDITSREQPDLEQPSFSKHETLPQNKSGTTTIGIVAEDGVVAATDRQMTMKTSIESNSTVKVDKITPSSVMTTSGLVGHSRYISNRAQSRARKFEMTRGREMFVSEVAHWIADYLMYVPLHVRPLIIGCDENGCHVYGLDGSGSIEDGPYKCAGSGASSAYGLIDDEYESDMSISEAKELARRAIISSKDRDIYSGGGLILTTITEADGVHTQDYDVFPDSDEL